MPSNEETRTGASNEAADADGLTCFTEAVYAYLQEIDSSRAVCVRHEGTAGVRERDGGLQVTRFFKRNGQLAAHFDSALRQLPHWEDAIREL